MLSEPRRKQKISLDPQNKHWAEDKTKFGYKMLMKLGWTDGKGLGKQENGSTSHVKVSRKTDNSGVGVKRSASTSNWIKHADAFSDLLLHLNDNTDGMSVTIDKPITSPHSNVVVSEDNSIKHRHRKSARSKDVRGYGKADLDAIFGRKSAFKEKIVLEVDIQQSTCLVLPEKNPSIPMALPTVVNKTSVSDYFKEKIATLGLTFESKSVEVEAAKTKLPSEEIVSVIRELKVKKTKKNEESNTKKHRQKNIENISKRESKKSKFKKERKFEL